MENKNRSKLYSADEINKLKEYVSKDKTNKEIANLLGRTIESVKWELKRLGIKRDIASKYEKDFERKFKRIYGNNFEYVGNYNGTTATIKCKHCGNEISKNTQVVRKVKGFLKCNVCDAERTRMIKEQKERIEQQKEKQYCVTPMKRWLKSNTIYIIKCSVCGCEFYGKHKNKTICGKACRTRANTKAKEIARRLRYKNAIKEKGIAIERLYKRDKGICYICGERCDYNDIKVTNDGYYITGNKYPTIEHVIPLSKGGNHTWNNVKLACFECNTKKRDKLIIPSG